MNSECHVMVIEYLIHNCFKNTVKALINETNKLEENYTSIQQKKDSGLMDMNHEDQWALLDSRKNLIEAIEQGNIPLAFDLINQHFPNLAAAAAVAVGQKDDYFIPNHDAVSTPHTVYFKLKCQRFIEIIKSTTTTTTTTTTTPVSSELEAIRYAQTHLKSTNNMLKEKVKEVTALIAYSDPYQSQSRHLLTQERRQQLAMEVNHVLLAHCHLPTQSSIEKITRQYSVVKEELEKTNVQLPQCIHREKMAI